MIEKEYKTTKLTFSEKVSAIFIVSSILSFSLGRFLSQSSMYIFIIILCSVILVIAVYTLISRSGKNRYTLFLIVFLLSTGYALYRNSPFPYPYGKPVTVKMKLTSYPRVAGGTVRYTSRLIDMREMDSDSIPEVVERGDGGGGNGSKMFNWREYRGKVLCGFSIPQMRLERGETVQAHGLFFELPYDREEGYARYLKSSGIGAMFEGYSGSVMIVKKPLLWYPVPVANRIKRYVERLNKRLLPPPHSDFATALLTGNRDILPSYLKEYFRRSGTMHILAVSGLHVGFLSGFFFFLLGLFRFNKNLNYSFLCVFLIFFMIFIGESSSVKRASLMALSGIACHLFDRDRNYLNALALSFVILWIVNPLMLANPGFLLSFCATFGILILAPVLNRALRKIMPVFFAVSLSVNFAVQIYIFPVMVAFFKNYPYINVIANIPIVPLTGISLALEVITLVSYPVFIPLAVILAEVNTVVISTIVRLARMFARIPPLEINGFPEQFIPLYLFTVTIGILIILGKINTFRDETKTLKKDLNSTAQPAQHSSE